MQSVSFQSRTSRTSSAVAFTNYVFKGALYVILYSKRMVGRHDKTGNRMLYQKSTLFFLFYNILLVLFFIPSTTFGLSIRGNFRERYDTGYQIAKAIAKLNFLYFEKEKKSIQLNNCLCYTFTFPKSRPFFT